MIVKKLIGNTPIIELKDSDLIPEGKTLFLKMEMMNFSFSIKARTAMGLISRAVKSGKLRENGVIIESTSGNLGRAIAAIAKMEGYDVILIVDPKAEKTLLNEYRALGAEIIVVDEKDELGGYQKKRIEKAKELEQMIDNSVWLNQYDNLDNSEYHSESTSIEIKNNIKELSVDILSSAVSTGGHLSGIAKGIKSEMDAVTIVAVDVYGSAIFDKEFKPYLINGPGLSFRAKNLLSGYIDKYLISTDLEAISFVHYLANQKGLMLGGSSGLSILAAIKALRDTECKTALAICPDAGNNYLNTLYDQEWLESKGILELLKLEDILKSIEDMELKEL